MAVLSSFTFRSKTRMVFLPESLSRPGSQLSSASLSPLQPPPDLLSEPPPPPAARPSPGLPPAHHLCSSPISHLPTRFQLPHQITSAPAHGAQASWFSLSNTRIKHLTYQSDCQVCLQGFVSAQGQVSPLTCRGEVRLCWQTSWDTFTVVLRLLVSRCSAKRLGKAACWGGGASRELQGRPQPRRRGGLPQGRHHHLAEPLTSHEPSACVSSFHPHGWGPFGFVSPDL